MAFQFNYKRSKGKPAVKSDNIADAVAKGVAAAIEPLNQKLDALLEGKGDGVKLDDAALELMGVESAEELAEVLSEAAQFAADTLEENGNPVAAAVIDAGIDVEDVVAELTKRRKLRKHDGEELEAVIIEEAAEVIAEVAEAVAAQITDEGVQELVDEGHLEEDEKEASASGTKLRGATGRKRSARGTKSAGRYQMPKQAAAPPFQRKYSDMFTTGRKSNQYEPVHKELPKEARLARAVKCSDYFARGGVGGMFADPERAAHAAEKYYKDATLARSFKSMTVSQPDSAGLLVPVDYVNDVIEMLYSATAIFELGARRISMPHGNLNIPRQKTGARAYFLGEARPIKASQPTFDMLRLSAKQLVAMVAATEQLLRSTDISSDIVFGRDLIRQMTLGIENAAFFGPGTEHAPLGLYANKDVELVNLLTINDAQIADAQGRPTADLPIFIRGKVSKKNVPGHSFGWAMNADAEQYFKRMKSTTGQFIWKEEMDKGIFNGNPYKVTNVIGTNMNTGTTTLFFGDWDDFLVGDQFGLETRTSYDATYMGADGRQVSAFDTVQTVTRATMQTDLGNRHDEAFIKVTNIKVFG